MVAVSLATSLATLVWRHQCQEVSRDISSHDVTYSFKNGITS